MANGGYLVPPSANAEDSRLWDETWKRLERFLPGMFREIFPEPVQSAPTKAAPAKAEQPKTEGAGAKPEQGAAETK